MSHIPNSAMPHARAAADDRLSPPDRAGGAIGALRDWGSRRAVSLRDRARDNPRVAMTAAATAALGLIAALGLPFIRRRISA